MADKEVVTNTTTTQKRAAAACHDCGRVHDRGNTTDRAARKARIIARDGAVCAWCTTPISVDTCEADRIVDGGRYSLANVVSACLPCNRERSDTPWREYLTRSATPEHALAIIMAATGGREPHPHLGR